MTGASIEDRVRRLERSLGRWRLATLGLAAIGGAGLLLGVASQPKSLSLDRLTVAEEIVVGDAERSFVAIGAVTAEDQDVSGRARWLESGRLGAYVSVRGGKIGSSADTFASEGAAEVRIGTTGAQIFMESAGEAREGSTRLQLRNMGGAEAYWSFGTRPGEGTGFLRENGERRDLAP